MQTHEDLSRSQTVKTSSDRFFGLTFFAVFLLIALWPLLGDRPLRPLALGTSFAFLAAALARPALLAPLNRLWLKFGALLHSITSPIILGFMFYLVIMPIGLVMRLTGKDLLRLEFEPESPTYWIRREPPGPDKNSLNRQF
ncbi:MAG: SxtJ family membrane protein [Pseudomonadota bacterium]